MKNGPAPRSLREKLAYDETFRCIQCGYCLPACPTYETMERETHSPRGRINLVKAAAEGRLEDLSSLAEAMDKCLGCRACETACPTGVEYGKIFASAREVLAERKDKPRRRRWAEKLFLRFVIPRKPVMTVLAAAAWALQKTGLLKGMEKTGLHRQLPGSSGAFVPALPKLSGPLTRLARPARLKPAGEKTFTVAFFTGCVMDVIYEPANRQSMRLLAESGCEVIVFGGAGCCGALQAHAGDREAAVRLARKNIERLERLERRVPVDYIVNAAGGCGAMLGEYEHLFEDPEWKSRAKRFSEKSRDLSYVLDRARPLAFRPAPDDGGREVVTYQPSCHMIHVQKNSAPPVRLMQTVPGVELRRMPDEERCCGSAGIYNVVQYDESMKLLDLKMSSVKEAGAHTVVTTNPGCLLQMQCGIAREGLRHRMRAVHLAEWLAEHVEQAKSVKNQKTEGE